jgi:WD40 repeat protein
MKKKNYNLKSKFNIKMIDIKNSKLNNNSNKIYISCNFPDCSLFSKKQITLPCCDSTICLEHLEKMVDTNDNTYKCNNCMMQKKLPDNGFKINKDISRSIDMEFNLNQSQKDTISKFELLKSSLSEHNSFNVGYWQNEYFNDLRNQVDIHREKLIQEIHQQSNKIITKLYELEEEVNNLKLSKTKNDFGKIDSEIKFWEKKINLRINEKELNELNKKFDEYIQNIKDDINKLKNESINHYCVEFKPIDSNLFGELIVKKLTPSFGTLVNSFNYPPDIIRSFLVDEAQNLLITSHETQIKVWSLETHELLRTLTEYDDFLSVTGHSYSGKETTMLIASNNRLITSNASDKRCKIYDLNHYHCTDIMTNKSGVKCMCLISNEILASGLRDGTINIWHLKYNKLETIKAHDDAVKFLKLSNDSTKLISYSSKNDLKVWSLNNFELLNSIEIGSKIISLETNPNNDIHLLSCADRSLKSFNLDTGVCSELVKFELGNWITCIKTISNHLLAMALANGIFIIYDLKENFVIKKFSIFPDHITQFDILSDGQLMTLSNRGYMSIRNCLATIDLND